MTKTNDTISDIIIINFLIIWYLHICIAFMDTKMKQGKNI